MKILYVGWEKRKRFFAKVLFVGGLSLLLLFILLCILRIYLLDWYSVPSGSMSPTLNVGDKVIVYKRVFGARIYKKNDFSEGAPLSSYRTKGQRRLQINDLVVFNFPLDSACKQIRFKINYVYVKRCVGLPGDTILIDSGFIKNSHYPRKIGLPIEQRKLSFMDSLFLSRNKAFPYRITGNTNWTIRNFGPFWIPVAGSQISLTVENIALYQIYIAHETGHEIKITANGEISLGGKMITEYVFTKNYYFMCGDHSIASYDSRNWGLVPEDFIIGVVGKIIKR